MELKHFVVQVNEEVYLKRVPFNAGWYPTHNIKDAEQFVSQDKAHAIAFKWGGIVVCCTVEIRVSEEDE
ncbi:hypothetical protein [Staphylococcus agnetis]|uniref:hypothetical protein n=1 Tax=Staphylococcus agnetis TaxID=985762 RepID=UPI0004E29B09|nr:hypothetical protein [Staphylococcus agnetis]KFE40755.1 hypothetical protein SAGN_11282 [Staphylococcus agnetis]PTH44760.1 hypothetical protein BU587_10880 [Staphylococcus agnetis]PTH71641.1 hypothetical protein BU581_11435 [Staphylococcus agnetis]PTH74372.1 hypothetical protein BU580_06450 [Staphylococcus agnetis]